MKKVWSLLLLVAMMATMLVIPVSAEVSPAEIPQSTRDDVLILFDGSMDNVVLQHPTADLAQLYEDTDVVLQGEESLFVDMPAGGIPWIGNFAMMLKITTEDIVSIAEYPISELSLYNGYETKELDQIQINYVDPENDNGSGEPAGDDSYNYSFDFENQEAGWHRLSHVVADSALPGWTLNPDNIDHVRVSWITDVDNFNEIDWYFDCLIIAKQSFYDDRAAAEAEMEGIVEALEVPTVDTVDALRESIESAKAKLDGYLAEFPNFMISNSEKMDEVWNAYRTMEAQAAADVIIDQIDALGEITLSNYEAKLTEIEAIDTAIDGYVDAGYSRNLITNLDILETARDACTRFGVEASIDALPTVDEVTLEDEETVLEVQSAVEDLSDDQQALIPQEKRDKITDLLAKIEELKNPYTLGDVNDDESIDAGDALMVLQFSVELIDLTETEQLAANVNGDTNIDAGDALMILQCSVELMSPEDFPAAQ